MCLSATALLSPMPLPYQWMAIGSKGTNICASCDEALVAQLCGNGACVAWKAASALSCLHARNCCSGLQPYR